MEYGGFWINRGKKEVDIDNIFVYDITLKVINYNRYHESNSIEDSWKGENCPKLKDVTEVELKTIYKL